MLASAMKRIAAGARRQRMRQQAAFQWIFARNDQAHCRRVIEARLLIGPEHRMFIKRLQPKAGPGRMALNAAHIIIALGEENGLNFVLEILEIQVTWRSLG